MLSPYEHENGSVIAWTTPILCGVCTIACQIRLENESSNSQRRSRLPAVERTYVDSPAERGDTLADHRILVNGKNFFVLQET